MKTNVKMSYDSGWKVTFPADGMAPRLFLEWIADYQKKISVSHPPFKIVGDNTGDESKFVVRFEYILRESVHELVSYIRDNS